MLEFFIKYWLDFLFSLVIAGLGFACKKIWNLYKSEKTYREEEQKKEMQEESKNGDQSLQDQIDILKSGILSIQRKIFKQECRELLKEEKEISLEEFEGIQEDHNIYNSLGGNHEGDILYNMVCKKAQNNLANEK